MWPEKRIAQWLKCFDDFCAEEGRGYSDEDDARTFQQLANPQWDEAEMRMVDLNPILSIKNNNPNKTAFRLKACSLDEEAFPRLGQILRYNTKLRHLDISRSDDEGGEEGMWICAGLRYNKSITELSIKSIWLDEEPLVMLGPFLSENDVLEKIALNSCGLELNDIDFISSKLMARHINDSLRDIDLSSNIIEDVKLDLLARAMVQCQGVKRLSLKDNGLSRIAVASIASLLRSDESALEELNLSQNLIDAHGASTLIDSLESNTKLKTLNLRGNRLTEADWDSLSQQVLQLVCNRNINKTAESNHTLSSLGDPSLGDQYRHIRRARVRANHLGVPLNGNELLVALFWLNNWPKNEFMKVRHKILWNHISGRSLCTGDSSLSIGLLPRILAFLGSVHTCKLCQETFGTKILYYGDDSQSIRSQLDIIRLQALYRAVRARPEICFNGVSDSTKLAISISENKNLLSENKRLADEINNLRSAIKSMCFVLGAFTFLHVVSSKRSS